MCINCYIEAGSPSIINDKTNKAAELIDAIYDQEDCGAGGYAHIVVDDWNLSDSDIDFCLDEATKKENKDISDESCEVIIIALKYLKTLSEKERYSAMAIHSGFLINHQ